MADMTVEAAKPTTGFSRDTAKYEMWFTHTDEEPQGLSRSKVFAILEKSNLSISGFRINLNIIGKQGAIIGDEVMRWNKKRMESGNRALKIPDDFCDNVRSFHVGMGVIVNAQYLDLASFVITEDKTPIRQYARRDSDQQLDQHEFDMLFRNFKDSSDGALQLKAILRVCLATEEAKRTAETGQYWEKFKELNAFIRTTM
ncbi:MAG: hypothetical protein ABR981_00055 [Candidatus Micrarchaeaceae archaeon]|jgi:hypothetical protein